VVSEEKQAQSTEEAWRVWLFVSGAFLAMLMGMAAKAGYDHFSETHLFAWKNIFLPLMVSPMVFGAVYTVARRSTDPILMLIFSFQNGFFWQAVLGGIGPSNASGGSH
jgi:hypothetical protein